jgi:hypothetical protein
MRIRNLFKGGWGNLGGAWTQVFMGTILFPAFERYYGSAEKSWRVICVIPASITFAWGALLREYCCVSETSV